MGLTSALQYLRKHGKTSDFSRGFPRLKVVMEMVTEGTVSQGLIEERWIEPYGDERGRDPDA